MRVADLRPGWRTDFILHRYGAQVLERDDCLVVRTPDNPTFYWGNCLVLPHAPAADAVAHWIARFEQEISGPQPASRHVAIGIDAEPQPGADFSRWLDAGFEVQESRMLRLLPGGLRPPARAPRGDVVFRPMDVEHEAEAVMDVEQTDAGVFDAVGYRDYLRRQWLRYRGMHDDGLLAWFGLWCDGTLAATCGLIRESAVPGGTGRFQRVVTHAQWRRRGLCSALVHEVCRFAFERWQVGEIYMEATPGDIAIGIYESLGFVRTSAGLALQRYAPGDGASAEAGHAG